MPRFYTRSGDQGTSAIFGGRRENKSSLIFHALGALDELNGALGIARAASKNTGVKKLLRELQNDLFRAGADIATPKKQKALAARISRGDITKIEECIDTTAKRIPSLTKFVISGESLASAHLHFARAVTRRAERALVAAQKSLVNPLLIPWVNRLSSLLFVLALREDLAAKKKFRHPTYRA